MTVVNYLDYLVFELVPQFFQQLSSMMIAPGVSLLGLILAVIVLVVVIGSVIFRVS